MFGFKHHINSTNFNLNYKVMADKLIFGIHLAVVVAGILLPFFGDRKHLLMYSILVPFVFFHWSVNDDTCALTHLESLLTDEPKDRTFMGRLMGPIYNVSDDAIGKLTKGVFFSLWFFTQWRLGLIKELIKSK